MNTDTRSSNRVPDALPGGSHEWPGPVPIDPIDRLLVFTRNRSKVVRAQGFTGQADEYDSHAAAVEKLRNEHAASLATIAELRAHLERVTNELHELVNKETDDPAVGIVGWNAMNQSVADARKALTQSTGGRG